MHISADEEVSLSAAARKASGDLELAQVISALTYALDLTEGYPQGHALRTCIYGMQIGRRIDLTPEELSDLFYALLLKDVGSSNNAYRSFESLGYEGAEARQLWMRGRSGYNWMQVAGVLRRMHQGRSPLRRTRALLKTVMTKRETQQELSQLRCELSAEVARDIGLSWATARAIYHSEERWDGRGHPDGLAGVAIPTLAQIVKLAQTIDAFHETFGRARTLDLLHSRCKGWFDPGLMCAATLLMQGGKLYCDLKGEALLKHVLSIEPAPQRLEADSLAIDHICIAFAKVIDARSPYTLAHSEGVAAIAGAIADKLGIPPREKRMLYRAALLHDIGKLGIPVSIQNKPEALNAVERKVMKEHSRFTYEILRRIPGFQEIAEVASAHHEKMDGSGYPRGLRAERLSMPARILAVADIYDALSNDRPYRVALPHDRVMALLRSEAPDGLDPECVEALSKVEVLRPVTMVA